MITYEVIITYAVFFIIITLIETLMPYTASHILATRKITLMYKKAELRDRVYYNKLLRICFIPVCCFSLYSIAFIPLIVLYIWAIRINKRKIHLVHNSILSLQCYTVKAI